MTSGIKDLRSLIERFESSEGAALPPTDIATPGVTAIGSVAEKALSSPLLKTHLAARGIEPREPRPCADSEELSNRNDWSLALVLSPYKREVRYLCDALTPAAERSGVIDTILQDELGKRVGINTNVFGAAHAMAHLMGGAHPERCLILGTGASARSCTVALRTLYGEPEIGVIGRNPDRTASIVTELSLVPVENVEDYAPDLLINTTTVGETTDGDLDYPIEEALVAGARFFDLNNRTSSLQKTALASGCVTISGVIMQLSVNALRAYVLRRVAVQTCAGS
jgi:shikimate dehydrogenase